MKSIMAKRQSSQFVRPDPAEWSAYTLLDSGDRRKLEQFGRYRLIRFEPQAAWKPALPPAEWERAHASFTIQKGRSSGQWHCKPGFSREWQIEYEDLCFQLRVQESRHIGLFPEQLPNWLWLRENIAHAESQPRLLNLFGYTGAASLFAVRAGASVTHVDASRSAEKWGQVNQELSGLKEKPLRWIVDDALKFVEREIRRGSLYDGILLDPPRFGRGPRGEVWKFEQAVPNLLAACTSLLTPSPLLVLLTAYDVPAAPQELAGWLADLTQPHHGRLESGWLTQKEKSAGRILPQAMFARWAADGV
jgi:23S rRNA (cytosine1962-C5)-methyltransferase